MRLDNFVRRVLSVLLFVISQISSRRSIKVSMSILAFLVNECMLIDLLLKLLKMYLNWRYENAKLSLFLKNNSIGSGSSSGFTTDLHEFEREHILVFFTTFSLGLVCKLLGDFEEDESERCL